VGNALGAAQGPALPSLPSGRPTKHAPRSDRGRPSRRGRADWGSTYLENHPRHLPVRRRRYPTALGIELCPLALLFSHPTSLSAAPSTRLPTPASGRSPPWVSTISHQEQPLSKPLAPPRMRRTTARTQFPTKQCQLHKEARAVASSPPAAVFALDQRQVPDTSTRDF
jgi:hypothetical protein